MNRRSLLLACALAASAGLAVFGDPAPAGDASDLLAPAATAPKPPAPAAAQAAALDAAQSDAAAPQVLRLRERPPPQAQLAPPDDAPGLFRATSWDPPPRPQPPVVPTAPPLPYAFVGKQFDRQEWTVFLSRGEAARIARTGAVLDGQYRVDSIQPPQLVLTYLPLQQQQTLSIGSAQ